MKTNMNMDLPKNPLLPDQQGFFGQYGGQYVPEILRPNLDELSEVFYSIINDQNFWQEYQDELKEFSGRPTPITYLKNISEKLGGAKLFLKREDLGQTGAHKMNNAIGQGLLMKKLGKKRVIAETGAGQHGMAAATMAARFGYEACIYMGAEDILRQRPNVFWMEKLGAKVISVEDGARTLKDAINAALRDWVGHLETSHYVLGSACGPHPFPALVSYFQSIIGLEARVQFLQKTGQLPDLIYACVGGGSNALGIFQGFKDDHVELIGVEAGGVGEKLGEHASRIASGLGSIGIGQGAKTKLLQNEDGQMIDTYSIAAGLDYIAVSPILAMWSDQGRVQMEKASDEEAIASAQWLIKEEGIIPALESAHALAGAFAAAKKLPASKMILVNLSGRGDKDIFTFAKVFHDHSWVNYLKTQIDILSA